jgi:DNA-binding GntR family transcriptional regulator
LDGTFPPGTPLVEVQLAAWCGVSRTPVREALTRLEQDGLVEKGERGCVVRERSPEEIFDIYEVRVILESLAARTAAERRRRVDVIRIEHALAAWESGGEAAEPHERARLNQDLHRAIWQASRSEPLMDLLSRLSLHLTRYPATTLMAPGRWESALTEHRALLDAIRDRDADRAAEVASGHFKTALEIRLALFKREVF